MIPREDIVGMQTRKRMLELGIQKEEEKSLGGRGMQTRNRHRKRGNKEKEGERGSEIERGRRSEKEEDLEKGGRCITIFVSSDKWYIL